MVKWRIILTFGLVFLCLIGLSYGCFQSVKAQFRGPIIINSDGSITPSIAPIQVDGDTYIVLENIFDSSLVIQRSDIVIDGANFLLQGQRSTGTEHYITPIGITLKQVSNVVVKNFELRDFGKGISAESTQNCLFNNNTLLTASYGIFLNISSYNQITDNTLVPNVDSRFTQNFAIFALDSNFNNVTGNQISGYWYEGITMIGSNNIVDANNVTEVGLGIEVAGSSNIISENKVFSTILATSKQIFPNSGTGIGIGKGNENLVVKNIIQDNAVGVGLSGSGSDVYQNNFINNTQQVQLFEESVSAIWDEDKVGNYWSDYQSIYPNASELDTSGIWNTPYAINENNIDHYPLKKPVNIYEPSNPTPTPTPFEPSRNPPHLDPTYYLIPISVIVAITILFLLLYSRHRKTTNLTK
jgi:parallel beta-helix repeat protein